MKSVIVSFFTLIPVWCGAQSIAPALFGTCGTTLGNANNILEWSAGEAAATTFLAPSFMLTEGFHQPGLIITGLVESHPLQLEVWPNPVSDILNLRGAGLSNAPLVVQIYDPWGQPVLHQDWHEAPADLQIPLSHLPAGAYTLVVSGGQLTRVHSWKIVKLSY